MTLIFTVSRPHISHTKINQISVYYFKYSNPITNQIYIYSTFVTLRNSLWPMALGEFWQKTFVTLLAQKRCDFTDFCYTLGDF